MGSLLLCSIAVLLVVHTSDASFKSSNEFDAASPYMSTTKNELLLEPINGTQNFRMHGKKGKDGEKKWFDEREMRYIYCVRPSKCEPLRFKTCFGSNLPYSSTSLDLTDAYSQEQTLEKLYSYQALRHVPKCWAVIQPFLCAVFIPKCESINGRGDMVYLPSLEMCKITQEPCKILYNTSYFPEFLKCNDSMFPSKCNNDVREMKFNATGQCLKPLVPTDSVSSYYKEIEGCGLECKDPLYTDDEHRQIHKLISWGGGVCLILNFFTIITFIIDWQNANKYPAVIIFYINFCYMISCLGWLAQFTPNSREDIVCRKDGTLRQSEPAAGENLSCIIVFILVYYFLIAAMVWFVIFTYVWHVSSKAIGKIQNRIDKKGAYFHLIAWSLPLILTITIMALSEVDGNSVVGICFVGYLHHPIRGAFLLGPVTVTLFVGSYFVGRGMIKLIRLKIWSQEKISSRDSNKIRQTIVRMGCCMALLAMFIVTTVVCHLSEIRHTDSWTRSLRDFIICTISSTYTDLQTTKCKFHDRPSVGMLQLHLLCLFASGITMSSWVWTDSTVETWSRFFRKKIGRDLDEPIKMQKHKVIAQAFAKRKEFQNQGRLSISFHNSHTDPVGLKFDVTSVVGSQDFSETWANNLPQFVNRRYALTGAATSSSQHTHDPRKNSVDSEISFSVCHVSVESRRNSVDSQVSVKIAEMKTKVASRSSRSGAHKSQKTGRHHRRRDYTAIGGRKYSRKESSTSVESQIITAIQQKASSHSSSRRRKSNGNESSFPNPLNLGRRSGIGALDAEQISDLIANGKLLFPFLNNQRLTTSEEDNISFKDLKLDEFLKQIGRKANESHSTAAQTMFSTVQQQHPPVHIQEYNTTDDEKLSLQSSKDHPKYDNGGRISKSSGKSSVKSRRSVRNNNASSSTRRNRHRSSSSKALRREEKKDKEKEKEKESNDVATNISTSSLGSDLGQLAIGLPSSSQSVTAISVDKMNNSHGSKQSCDVGIQANAHEIATMTSYEYELNEKNLKNEENEDIYMTESHSLLPKQQQKMMIGKHRSSITESEKLKLLLLPSK